MPPAYLGTCTLFVYVNVRNSSRFIIARLAMFATTLQAKVRSAIGGSGGGRIAVASGTCLYDIDAHRLPRPAAAGDQSERRGSQPTNHSPSRAALEFHWLSITWIRYFDSTVAVIGQSPAIFDVLFISHFRTDFSIYLLKFTRLF